MNTLVQFFIKNTSLIFRIVIFLAFFGHSLVSFGFSPGYQLHVDLINSILSLFGMSSELTSSLITFQAYFDLFIGITVLLKLKPLYNFALFVGIIYLIGVAFSAFIFYFDKTGNLVGFSEVMRRFPWICFMLYLLIKETKQKEFYYVLRLGLAFAFLSHGLASLGIMGFNGGHVELASKIITKASAQDFIMYSGITDTVIGTLLLISIFSRLASYIGIFWIAFIVFLSFIQAFPDGIFRSGFLIAALYVAFDRRCHMKQPIWFL